jgi:hypothetical protein
MVEDSYSVTVESEVMKTVVGSQKGTGEPLRSVRTTQTDRDQRVRDLLRDRRCRSRQGNKREHTHEGIQDWRAHVGEVTLFIYSESVADRCNERGRRYLLRVKRTQKQSNECGGRKE